MGWTVCKTKAVCKMVFLLYSHLLFLEKLFTTVVVWCDAGWHWHNTLPGVHASAGGDFYGARVTPMSIV